MWNLSSCGCGQNTCENCALPIIDICYHQGSGFWDFTFEPPADLIAAGYGIGDVTGITTYFNVNGATLSPPGFPTPIVTPISALSVASTDPLLWQIDYTTPDIDNLYISIRDGGGYGYGQVPVQINPLQGTITFAVGARNYRANINMCLAQIWAGYGYELPEE